MWKYTTGILFCGFTLHYNSAPIAGKVIYELYEFPNRFTSLYFCIFYLGLLTTDVARSGQRQVPFLKPHLLRRIDTA